MHIQHIKHPFNHTIIYDFFEENEIEKIFLESNLIEEKNFTNEDHHHKYLDVMCNSKSFNLDQIFENNLDNSVILTLTKKIDHLKLYQHNHKNPFLGYFLDCSGSSTYITKYKNNSYYPPHSDGAILTSLFFIYLKEFEGGKLNFPEHNYSPKIKHNSVLIFPSYQIHKLGQIVSKNEGYVRYSINKRYFI